MKVKRNDKKKTMMNETEMLQGLLDVSYKSGNISHEDAATQTNNNINENKT